MCLACDHYAHLIEIVKFKPQFSIKFGHVGLRTVAFFQRRAIYSGTMPFTFSPSSGI